MPKGFSTQGVMILAKGSISSESIEQALNSFEVVNHRPAEGEPNWIGGYESWIVAYRPEVNGYAIVDAIDSPWPDGMGDPKSDPMLFGAWSMGLLGPHTWPGNLARAVAIAEMTGSQSTAAAADSHASFIRIRTSYVLGADDNAPVMPEDYDARKEFDFVISLVQALLRMPEAICYFNPGGEVLMSGKELDKMLRLGKEKRLAPSPIWSTGRLTKSEEAPGWMIADVIGMEQVGGQDQEACFREGTHEPNEVIGYLRDVAQYILDQGPVIKSGHTGDGPGGRWRAVEVTEGLLPGPRFGAMRWRPDGENLPPALLVNAAPEPKPTKTKSGLFSGVKSLFRRK